MCDYCKMEILENGDVYRDKPIKPIFDYRSSFVHADAVIMPGYISFQIDTNDVTIDSDGDVSASEFDGPFFTALFNINYCPMCGRKLERLEG